MPFEQEAARNHSRDAGRASLQLEHSPASTARKMVVMRFPRRFIAARFSGRIHRHKCALVTKRFQRPIHRCDAHARNLALRTRQNLLRREGTGGLLKYLANGATLCRITFHESTLRSY